VISLLLATTSSSCGRISQVAEIPDDVVVVAEAGDGQQVLSVERTPSTSCSSMYAASRTVWTCSMRCGQTKRSPRVWFDNLRRCGIAFEAAAVVLGDSCPKTSVGELLAAIRAVAAGANWFQPALTSSLRQAFDRRRNGAVSRLCQDLTEREIEVLRLMAGGMTNKKIAATLKTAEGTVKNQVSSILSKMGVTDRIVAVLNAIEFGII
jgi:DNA-binding CsgD family transcriptional regulator